MIAAVRRAILLLIVLAAPASAAQPALPERPRDLPEGVGTAELLWQVGLEARPRRVETVVAEGRLVFTDGPERLRAVDAASGRELWSLGTAVAGLAYRRDTIYLGEEAGYITALSAQTGEVAWRFDTGGSAIAAPIPTDNRIYGLGNYYDDRKGRWSGYLWSLTPGGQELWRVVHRTRAFAPDHAAGPERIYIRADDPDGAPILGVDNVTGKVTWRSAPVRKGRIVAHLDGTLLVHLPRNDVFAGFRPAGSGRPAWTWRAARGWRGRPAFADGQLYLVGSADGERWAARLVALEAATGREIWAFETGRLERDASPAARDGLVCIGTRDGYLFGIDAARGAARWIFAAPERIDRRRVGALQCRIGAGRVYAWDDSGHLFALEAVTGRLAWAHRFPRDIARLAVAGGMVWAFVDDRRLYALE